MIACAACGMVSLRGAALRNAQSSPLPTCAQAGGRLQSTDSAGFRHDTGPSLLLFPDKCVQLWLFWLLPTHHQREPTSHHPCPLHLLVGPLQVPRSV